MVLKYSQISKFNLSDLQSIGYYMELSLLRLSDLHSLLKLEWKSHMRVSSYIGYTHLMWGKLLFNDMVSLIGLNSPLNIEYKAEDLVSTYFMISFMMCLDTTIFQVINWHYYRTPTLNQPIYAQHFNGMSPIIHCCP